MIKKMGIILTMCMIVGILAACGSTPLAITPDSTTNTAVAASISTPNIDALVAMVNQFVTSGDITGNVENGLLAKLATIKQKVTDGQVDAAVNELGAFINQVQAQQGKKISDTAVNALMNKVQETIAAMQPGVSATSTTATTTTQPPAPSTLIGPIVAPKPMGDLLPHEPELDKTANEVAVLVGFTDFTYEIYKLPANTAWLDTLKYYDTQAAISGWGASHTQTSELAGGHYAAWTVVNGETTSYYALVQMDNAQQGSFTFNITGKN